MGSFALSEKAPDDEHFHVFVLLIKKFFAVIIKVRVCRLSIGNPVSGALGKG